MYLSIVNTGPLPTPGDSGAVAKHLPGVFSLISLTTPGIIKLVLKAWMCIIKNRTGKLRGFGAEFQMCAFKLFTETLHLVDINQDGCGAAWCPTLPGLEVLWIYPEMKLLLHFNKSHPRYIRNLMVHY